MINISKDLLNDEPYISQQEGELKIEEIEINQPNEQENDNSSQELDQKEYDEYKKIYEILQHLREKQEESKEQMALELKKQVTTFINLIRINEIQQYIMTAVDIEIKEKLQRDLSELEEGSKNVKFFYKFIDENCKTFSSILPQELSFFNDRKSIKNEEQHIKVELNLQSDSNTSDEFSNKVNNYKRGPYKRYTPEIKEEALIKIKQGYSVREVCNEMNIPKKNLRRWIEIGAERKKGGGRKRMDQEMEDKLHRWCIEESLKKGRPKALEFSKFPEKFKASKGWTDKFVKKYNLRKQAIKQLQERGLYKQYHQRKLRQQQKQASKIKENKYPEQENDQILQQQAHQYEEFKTKREQDDGSVFESSEEDDDESETSSQECDEKENFNQNEEKKH